MSVVTLLKHLPPSFHQRTTLHYTIAIITNQQMFVRRIRIETEEMFIKTLLRVKQYLCACVMQTKNTTEQSSRPSLILNNWKVYKYVISVSTLVFAFDGGQVASQVASTAKTLIVSVFVFHSGRDT